MQTFECPRQMWMVSVQLFLIPDRREDFRVYLYLRHDKVSHISGYVWIPESKTPSKLISSDSAKHNN